MQGCEEDIHSINGLMLQVNKNYESLALMHIVGSQQEQIDHVKMQMEELKKMPKMNLHMLLKQMRKCEFCVYIVTIIKM
jgi:hypothetical protein